jgi:hypothetical protein
MRYLIILIFAISLYGETILGKVDKFDLPQLGLYGVKAKIDTGAKTSSIHCNEVIVLKNNYVKFSFPDQNGDLNEKYIIKPISRVSNVKSSNGESEKRYFIKTNIMIYNKAYEIEVSLSFREQMIYPLLIGRELLKQGFVVDVSKKFLSYKSKKSYNKKHGEVK